MGGAPSDPADLLGGPMLILAGSGISCSAPANLPTAQKLIEVSAAHHLAAVPRDLVSAVVDGVQPEVYYEELRLFLGEEALAPLCCLAGDARPTLAHYAMVAVAADSRLPIITTNFDPLFEHAAAELGVPHRVVLQSGPFDRKSGELEIWKVHGSLDAATASSAARLASTMPTITQANPPLLEAMATLLRSRVLCIVGYSGRDIDLFPFLYGVTRTAEGVLWIDIRPDGVATRNQWLGASVVEGRCEELLLPRRPDLRQRLEDAGIDVTSLAAATPSATVPQALDRARLALQAGRALTEREQELFLAACLRRVGLSGRADRYFLLRLPLHLAEADGRRRLQARLMVAALADDISDYRRSEQEALAARAEADELLAARPEEPQLLAGKVSALHAIAMAKKMQLGPRVTLPEVELRPRRDWQGFLRVAVVYALFALRMRQLVRRLDRVAAVRDPWRLLAWNRYFDHRLVGWALVARAPGTRAWVARRLRRLEGQARDLGDTTADAHVLAHVQKQLQDLGEDVSKELGLALMAYELLGDPQNRALVHRNDAIAFERQGRIDEARREYESMLALALACGSNATALKAIIGLHSIGGTVDRDVALQVTKAVTGEGYERLAAALRRALALPPLGAAR